MSECIDRHIVLIGMMGAGKSAVGRVLSARLDRELLDSDQIIEERTGRSVREIFETDGEAEFRRIEAEVIADAVAAETPSVIAAAGGVVLSDANREVLKGDGAHVVWLLADVELLLQRVRNGMHRPMLDADPEGTLRKMHDDRCELYQEVADAIVSVEYRSVKDVAGAVMRCAG